MKATGMIRRIDELGRIVIPKEIRNNLKIKNGESLEIFTNQDEIILKKYSSILNIDSKIKRIGRIITEVLKCNLMITDQNKIVYASDEAKENKELNKKTEAIIENRQIIDERLSLDCFNENEKNYYIVPIINNTDSIGLVVIYNDMRIDDFNKKICLLIKELICEDVDINI